MPNRVLRVALAISALLAALLLAGVGAGIGAADPGDPGDPDTTSEPPTGEPQPTSTTTAPTPDLPRTIAGILNDLLHKPFTIFGNGRVPGQPPKPVVVNPDGTTAPTKERGRDNPASKPDPPEVKPPPEPVGPDPNSIVPQPKASSSFNVVLPFSPPVSIPLPPVPVPGYESLRLTLDLTDPYTALASVQETTNTINSLLADAYAPYNPFKPPPPEPQPTFKILQEEPVVEASGGQGNQGGPSESSGDLSVLAAPGMAPPVRIAMPRPVAGATPAASGEQVPGTVGVRSPVQGGSVTQAGTTPAGANASAAMMGRPTVRQGYQQYLRSARTGQVATIAVPGLMGLLALTASGVVTGYRQANSQRFVRAEAARFLP